MNQRLLLLLGVTIMAMNASLTRRWFLAGLLSTIGLVAGGYLTPAKAVEPLPDRIAVLTFDDSSRSHIEVARPLLKKYGFSATFFITEGFDFKTNKKDYLTWDEVKVLHQDGFEIGNHTRDHKSLDKVTPAELKEQLQAIEERCAEHGIPKPVSLSYPGNGISPEAVKGLKELGILFARRGGAPEYSYESGQGAAYQPGKDSPLLIPSAVDVRPAWGLDEFVNTVNKVKPGEIAVIQFHGVPDTAHDWVSTTAEKFESYLRYLAEKKYKVIAMRDLKNYVDPTFSPEDPFAIIKQRQAALKK